MKKTAILAFVLVIAMMAIAMTACSNTQTTEAKGAEEGGKYDLEYKAIITVIFDDGETETPYEIKTDSDTVGEALASIATVEDGKITAFDGKAGTYSVTKNGSAISLGDAVADKDVFTVSVQVAN